MTPQERKTWSHLGAPPQVVIDAPTPITRAWKALVQRTKQVVRLRGVVWEIEAKKIEAERERIILWAERVAAGEPCHVEIGEGQ